MTLALVLPPPAAATLWVAGLKPLDTVAPTAPPLGAAAAGALAVNLLAAALLARHRRDRGSLAVAALMSARNDALANLSMIAAALVTARLWASAWPDLIVGLGLFWLNLEQAQAILSAARRETDPTP